MYGASAVLPLRQLLATVAVHGDEVVPAVEERHLRVAVDGTLGTVDLDLSRGILLTALLASPSHFLNVLRKAMTFCRSASLGRLTNILVP